MKTPYLDKEINLLEGYKKEGTASYYQSRKLAEYRKIKQLLMHSVVDGKTIQWQELGRHTPHCYETGDWDGKRSDFMLVVVDGTEIQMARAYGGTMDGSRFLDFYDKNDYEIIGNISHFADLPSMP